jgi:hypothetical protein
METLVPFDFEIIGLHFVGWMDVEIDPERYETTVLDITINQISRVVLPISVYLSLDQLPDSDRKQVQEFADQWVDENWNDICRDHVESLKADRDDDY